MKAESRPKQAKRNRLTKNDQKIENPEENLSAESGSKHLTEDHGNDRPAEFRPKPEDLRASGCTLEQIEQFGNCRCTAEKLRFLQHHRDQLLDSIHEQERQISTLDYLTYQMGKTAGHTGFRS